tara:strand:+ start:60 stop:473 length:414 start_codon:yes stop_codon:yes gene_type:complete
MVNIHVIAVRNGKIYDPYFEQYDRARNKIAAKDVAPVYKILEGEEEREWFLKIHKGTDKSFANMRAHGKTTEDMANVFYINPQYQKCYWNAWAYKFHHPEAKIKVCWFGFASKKKGKVCWLYDGAQGERLVVKKYKH